MVNDDASQFYTGVVAELYNDLRSQVPDSEVYARFVERSGEPALELGCGTGDPLLDLRARGLNVEGLDSSADMLRKCRDAAEARGIDVVLHEQSMQEMNLGRIYRSIYLAGPTFNLLPDDDSALESLRAIESHLDAGGTALVPLFIPQPTPREQLQVPKEHTTDDGRKMRFMVLSEERDEDTRTHTQTLRYELTVDGREESVDRPFGLHWYTQDQFRELAVTAGLSIRGVRAPNGAPAEPDDDAFAFQLHH